MVNLCQRSQQLAAKSGGKCSLFRSRHQSVFVFNQAAARTAINIQLSLYGRNRNNVWRYPIADGIMDCAARHCAESERL